MRADLLQAMHSDGMIAIYVTLATLIAVLVVFTLCRLAWETWEPIWYLRRYFREDIHASDARDVPPELELSEDRTREREDRRALVERIRADATARRAIQDEIPVGFSPHRALPSSVTASGVHQDKTYGNSTRITRQ